MDENNNQLLILKTEDDKTGFSIARMSNFVDTYVSYSLAKMGKASIPVEFKIDKANFHIIGDTVKGLVKKINKETSLIPDFDRLPSNIKKNLAKGIYSIGESKQVDGNYRPVILDEKGVRIKDITLKKVNIEKDSTTEINNIQQLIQLKKINENLEIIQELQYYQIERARDSAVLVPFYDARDLILRAQHTDNFEKQKEYLEQASLKLDHAFNETARELETDRKFLADNSSKIFKKQKLIDVYVEHMSDDIQEITTICGIQMHIADYLGKPEEVQIAYQKYKNFMISYANNRNNRMGLSGFELMHDNCNYNDDNRDCWYEFSNKLVKNLSSNSLIESKEVLLVGLEDVESE